MKLVQLARDRIAYPGLFQEVKPHNPIVKLVENNMIILREISREEAGKEISALFSNGHTLYYSDIAEELRLDLELVVDICNELQENGEIAVDARVS